jgi:hypothetical protein
MSLITLVIPWNYEKNKIKFENEGPRPMSDALRPIFKGRGSVGIVVCARRPWSTNAGNWTRNAVLRDRTRDD